MKEQTNNNSNFFKVIYWYKFSLTKKIDKQYKASHSKFKTGSLNEYLSKYCLLSNICVSMSKTPLMCQWINFSGIITDIFI